MNKASIIGIGLIGGSLAIDLRKNGLAKVISGVDLNVQNLEKAKALGLIDYAETLEESCKTSDLLIIATPINASPEIIDMVLTNCKDDAIIMDVGSLKASVCNYVANHPERDKFVACHPIAGTEFSGPEAAISGLFEGKINIICEEQLSADQPVHQVKEIFNKIGARNISMDAATHDKHITYVSHLSHITSFALSLTVQELEKNEENIFNMAGSGFDSTVRLAKSSADMWAPIFTVNKKHMLDAIDAYMVELNTLKGLIKNDETRQIKSAIRNANEIKRIL